MPHSLNDLSWLIGTWKNTDDKGIAYEVWNKENDTLYTGKSFYLKGKDTIPQETMLLRQKGTELLYIPTVVNQNNGEPVQFRLTNITKEEAVFENPTHDFPQKITYRNMGTDSLMASISGTLSGKTRVVLFPMSRMK